MINNEKIAIVGAGGFGSEVFHLLKSTPYKCVGFIDKEKINADFFSPIIGYENEIESLIKKFSFSNVVIAIGDIKTRKKIFNKIKIHKLKFPPILDISLQSFSAELKNNGIIIYPNVVIMNGCSIGRFTLINSGSTLGHDVSIGDFCNINPGVHLAGNIIIGNNTLVGIGSTIKEGITIGSNVIIGAGSVVINNIPDNTTVYGVPAKKQSRLK